MIVSNFHLNPEWILITIVDPKNLPGESILTLIKLLLKVVKYEFVILDYIYGAGILPLIEKENNVITINELMNMLPEVKQFDWGDFFLFKEYPKHWNNNTKELYPYVIAQTDTTIRAVDDGYIYVYTPYPIVADIIKKKYEIESLKIDMLEKLDYPD